MDLKKYLKSGSYHIRIKAKIVSDVLDGATIQSVCKKNLTYYTSVMKLIEMYKKNDKKQFEACSIAKPRTPLMAPLSVNEKEKIAELIKDSSCEAFIRNCNLILNANRFYNYSALANSIGVKCPKTVKKYILRYKDEGIMGLLPKSTGKAKMGDDIVADRLRTIEQAAESLWEKQEFHGFVTDADLAKILKWSEPTIEKALRSRQYDWRKSSKTWYSDICKMAKELTQTVIGFNEPGATPDQETISVYDRIFLECDNCNHKREIAVSTLKYDRPNCPVCVHKRMKNSRYITQTYVVNLIEAWYNHISDDDLVFFHDVMPSFMYKHSKRYFRVDGLCSQLKVVVEYQGALHNRAVKLPGLTDPEKCLEKHLETVANDIQKRQICSHYGYTLIEVAEIMTLTLENAIKAIVEAFIVAEVRVPTEEELRFAYHHSPRLGRPYLTDAKKANCINRILEGKSTVVEEAARTGFAVSTIYRCLREHKDQNPFG